MTPDPNGDTNSSTSDDGTAREILDAGSYVVLATAAADGAPWASPVWFAQEDYREVFWVSSPEARHSQNIAVRPLIGMVVFDPAALPGSAQAVYMSATAEQVLDPDAIERGLAVFSRVSARKGVGEWSVDRISGEARLRLYRATVIEHSILDPEADTGTRVVVHP